MSFVERERIWSHLRNSKLLLVSISDLSEGRCAVAGILSASGRVAIEFAHCTLIKHICRTEGSSESIEMNPAKEPTAAPVKTSSERCVA